MWHPKLASDLSRYSWRSVYVMGIFHFLINFRQTYILKLGQDRNFFSFIFFFVKKRTKRYSKAVDNFLLPDMIFDMCTLYVSYPVFMWDMLFTLLPHSSLCTHSLLRFFMRFSYTQLAFEMYPALCRSWSRTLATSLFVTIVKAWLIFKYYHKKLYLRYYRDPRSPCA